MAYVADDIYSVSQARQTQENLRKIGVAIWDEQNIQDKVFCPVCNVKLMYTENGRFLWCKECGQKTPVEEVKHEKKLTSKFVKSQAANPIVVSKGVGKKRRSVVDNDSVNASLSDEDLLDLRRMGYRI